MKMKEIIRETIAGYKSAKNNNTKSVVVNKNNNNKELNMRKVVTVYTDGSCLSNPGKGGYAAILSYNGREKVVVGCEANTTNNRMELRAVIEALSVLKESVTVNLYSDSSYVVNGINEWLSNWVRKGFKKVKNIDLWKSYLKLAEAHKVIAHKVAGHMGVTLNERCDKLAVAAAKGCGSKKTTTKNTTTKVSVKTGYINYSGGAKGADLAWDKIGREYGFNKHIHFRPADYDKRSAEKKKIMDTAYEDAIFILKRKAFPATSYVGKLIRRDYLQAANADAIYAISTIINSGDKDPKGYTSRAKRPVVAGGTGYAIEFGIMLHKSIYVFDQVRNAWYTWDYAIHNFNRCATPVLAHRYAGIGTREIAPNGLKAIRDVYSSGHRAPIKTTTHKAVDKHTAKTVAKPVVKPAKKVDSVTSMLNLPAPKAITGYLAVESGWPKAAHRGYYGVVEFNNKHKDFYGINIKNDTADYKTAGNDRNRITIIGLIHIIKAMKAPVELTVFVNSKYAVKFVNSEHSMADVKNGKNGDLWVRLILALKEKHSILHLKHTSEAKDNKSVAKVSEFAKNTSLQQGDYINDLKSEGVEI